MDPDGNVPGKPHFFCSPITPVNPQQGKKQSLGSIFFSTLFAIRIGLKVQSTKSTMGLTLASHGNETLTFAISFCKTFWGAPTSSASVAYNLNKRLFYNGAAGNSWNRLSTETVPLYLPATSTVKYRVQVLEYHVKYYHKIFSGLR
jgi:hypothetical protein